MKLNHDVCEGCSYHGHKKVMSRMKPVCYKNRVSAIKSGGVTYVTGVPECCPRFMECIVMGRSK